VGPVAMLDALERVRAVTDCPLSAQPNAGLPRSVDGRNIYLASPEYMASYARRFLAAGARLIGGCCGTTPEHVRAIRKGLKSGPATASARPRAVEERSPSRESVAAELVPRERKSRLAARL